MIVLAIDPGPERSGWVRYDTSVLQQYAVAEHGTCSNSEMIEIITSFCGRFENGWIVIEMVQSFGMAVGAPVFETCVWIGRYVQTALLHTQRVRRIYRKDVKLCICHNTAAKAANIRQALIDRFPASGGGKIPQIGVKHNRGPLFGVTDHVWAALALAITHAETNERATIE